MSGAAKLVMMSSSPVLTSVTVDVRTSNESDVRKKRSAGRAASHGVAMEADIAVFFIVAPAGRYRNKAGRKDNSQSSAVEETDDARAAWVTLLVNLGPGWRVMAFNC